MYGEGKRCEAVQWRVKFPMRTGPASELQPTPTHSRVYAGDDDKTIAISSTKSQTFVKVIS